MIHVVKAGESLYSIGVKYGVSAERIAITNGIEGDKLAVGQALLILKPMVTHVVKAGESLYSIAQRYGITVKKLIGRNPDINTSFTLYPSESLVISYEGERDIPMAVNGYAYPFIDELLLRESLPYLSMITVFTYGINNDGSLIGIDDGRVLRAAKLYGATPVMLISTLTAQGVFSNALAREILNDDGKTNVLINDIALTIEEKGYGGIDVDFEFVYAEDRERYALFLRRLRDRLKPLGIPVIVALAPKYSDEQEGLIYEGHDYGLLGEAADYALVMTYEWGYTYGPPMAVAPLNEVKRVLDYALSRIPAKKIFMGIPNYGYDWTLPYVRGESRAESIGNMEAVDIAIKYGAEIEYDEKAQSPFFNYTDGEGREHTVWFEDVRSIRAKLKTAADYGLFGVSYWNVMRPFTVNWMEVSSLYNAVSI